MMRWAGRAGLLAVFLLAGSSAVLGQTDDPPAEEAAAIESITVVGTAIRGTPIDSPYAVAVVAREELERQGSPLMTDFFKSMGVSHGVVGERSSWYNSSQSGTILESVSNVNLRGLGASRTLVLINGRRQTYIPARLIGGRFVDVSVLPAIALDRLEVLKEGASAIYGSDAVSGITNFVTRRDFDGLEMTATYEGFDGANRATLGGIWGGDVGDAQVVIALEHDYRGELQSRERSWSQQPLLDPWRASWSTLGNPGHFWFPNRPLDAALTPKEEFAAGIADRAGKNDPLCEEFGGDPRHFSCLLRFSLWVNMIEEMRKTRSFAEVNGPWGDRGSYHFEALWSDSVIPDWVTQPSYPGFHHLTKGLAQIGPEHPGRREFCGRHGGAEGEFGGECAGSDNWYFRGRPFGYGSTARTLTRKSRTWRLAFSLEGEFDGLGGREMTYDLGVSWSRSENNLNKPGIFTERMFLAFRGYGGPNCGVGVVPDRELAPGMRLGPTEGRTPGADGCLYYNPFSNALEFSDQPGAPFHDRPNPDYRPELANDPELVRWLNGGVSDRRSETELLVGDFALSGSWIEDRLGYALGYQFRRFVAAGDPNELGDFTAHPCPVLGDLDCGLEDRIGPYITTSMNYPYREDQTVHRVFGELAIQLSEPIDVQLAADYERYDQASSVDPKLALRWRLSDYLTLRGSVQTTFRTPSVDDLTPDVPLTTYQYARPTGTWVPIDRYGDPDLDPERAFTFNLGLIAFPTPSIELTVDYWNYDFKDVIGDVPHNLVVRFYNDPATRDQVSRYLHCRQGRADQPGVSCPPREIVRVELPLLNWPGVETAGMDWQLSGRYEWGPGRLVARLSGTHTLDYRIKALYLDDLEIYPDTEVAGRLNWDNPLVVPIPRWKGRFSLSYHWSDYTLSAYVKRTSSYRDDPDFDGRGGMPLTNSRVDSFTTFDLSLLWHRPDTGLSVILSALNLTDEDPPFANLEHAYDGLTHSPKGRRLKLAMRYRFGGE